MTHVRKFLMQCLVVIVVVAMAHPAWPQNPEPPQSQGPAIKSQVNLVNLFVTVRDKKKTIVEDLKQEDFKIAEDGQEQKIAFFNKVTALPITMGLLLDTSGSEQDMLSAIQDGGSRFINRVLRKGDEAMVMSFASDVDLMSDFTDDKGQLDRAIHKTRIAMPDQGMRAGNPGPIGGNQHITGTALYDAIYLACNEKLTTEAGRKALIIVTDAQDEGSKVRIEEAIEAAQRTDTVIHILLVIDPRFGGNVGAAHRLADDTGGRVISVRSNKNMEDAY